MKRFITIASQFAFLYLFFKAIIPFLRSSEANFQSPYFYIVAATFVIMIISFSRSLLGFKRAGPRTFHIESGSIVSPGLITKQKNPFTDIESIKLNEELKPTEQPIVGSKSSDGVEILFNLKNGKQFIGYLGSEKTAANQSFLQKFFKDQIVVITATDIREVIRLNPTVIIDEEVKALLHYQGQNSASAAPITHIPAH